ncbi:vacuolar protein sorting-associated protein 53 [Thecamonas trahens ATCC 50062]|uniref:Vacuolar protein sorting-associated protein 53 n=1 Tax=Thecamonas trahens ATCC 50062 TaxID=461836 RepID=A0A0L0D6N3_THETB|nr:vacuolar protein sorting-associated protein 53 [Thecamonas trahens ATCC 50062]KNC48037.1 vacuolar protein sorting-associated protein 53 [Thecamonas trahens ATCC 50062]|eukprot:XP_013759052.1 vacuolar protein sorting-associated protein 53 [Thecamonas trahens ATCC 50062]
MLRASSDLLATPDLSVVDYINTVFPDQASLQYLPKVTSRVQFRLRELEAQINSTSREHLSAAKKAISELFTKIAEIKAKAAESEAMVQSICADIKILDTAKCNLSKTISLLHRLRMMVKGVDQLERARERGDFAEVAQLLKAVTSLSSDFESYGHIAKIREMQQNIAAIRGELKGQMLADFEDLGARINEGNRPAYAARTAVVAALGDSVVSSLVDAFVGAMVGTYEAEFGREGGPNWSLESSDARFTWLVKAMRSFDDTYAGVFPDSWRVAEKVAIGFCEMTCEHLRSILEGQQDNLNVPEFLRVVQSTLDVEMKLAAKFKVERVAAAPGRAVTGDGSLSSMLSVEEPEVGGLSESEALKLKYKRYRASRHEAEEPAGGSSSSGAPAVSYEDNALFKGIISRSFEPYMNHYIAVEDKNLAEMMERFVAQNAWYPEDEHSNILTSATDLVFYFRKSLMRCSSISKGQALFDLYKTFRKYLVRYTELLVEQLPKGKVIGEARSYDGIKVRLSPTLVINITNIIHTAVYVQQQIEALQETLARKIARVFSDHIDFGAETREYTALIGKAVLVLVIGTLTVVRSQALEPMTKLGWGAWTGMTENPPHLVALGAALADDVPQFRDLLPDVYFRRYCDKLVVLLVQAFRDTVLLLGRIADEGSDQLLLDSQTLRALLLELPNLAAEPRPIPRGFVRVVNKELDKLDAVLKVLKTPPEAMVDMYTASVPSGNASQLRKIFEAKGLKKSQINAYMALYTGPPGDVDAPDDDLPSEDDPAGTSAAASESSSRTARLGRKLLGRFGREKGKE